MRPAIIAFRRPVQWSRSRREVRRDLFQRFVLGLGQVRVEVHQTADAQDAEQHERVVETDRVFEIQIKFGHEKAEEEIHRGTDAAAQVFAPSK